MTLKQLDEINERAVFHPQNEEYTRPAIEVAGAFVFAYVDEAGVLRVSVHLEEATPDVFPCDCVPLQVTVGSTVVYQAGRDGSDEIGVERRSTDGPPTVIHRTGEPLLVFGQVDVLTGPNGWWRGSMPCGWASLPIQRPASGAPISEVLIAAGGVQVLRDVVVGRYRDARWWPSRGPVVLAWLDYAEEASGGQLWLFNLTLIQLAALYLGIETQLCVQEPLRQRGTAGIVELCSLYGVDRYLSGNGGRAYLDETQMQGIEVLWSIHCPASDESLLTVLFDYDDPSKIVRATC